MRIGIVGLPQSGKTTLFTALTHATIDEKHSPQSGKDVNHSIVKVPDSRLEWLNTLYPTAKKTQATVEYWDVAGLSKGSTKQQGFQDRFLANLKNIDALLCVLRFFTDESVPHPETTVDPKRDLSIIEDEFLLSDLSILENRVERLSTELKKIKNPERQKELELLQKCLAAVESEIPLRELDFSEHEQKMLRGFQFLTAKPMLIVLNIGDADLEREDEIKQQCAWGVGKKKKLDCISAKLEKEISQLPDEDRKIFQQELGIKEPGLNKVIRDSYSLLGLISFLTAGEKEVRAWTIKARTRAQIAAGAIHSDIERGFIRAEVVDYITLNELGTFLKCKEQGKLRLEGKDYIVQDGDVITFRFNV
ncbi:MAG: redox-regulated ATPase YchF [bacterium]